MLSTHETLDRITSLLRQKDKKSRFQARQLLFLNSPLSKLVELYLHNNEGEPQKLDKIPMMRPIYDEIPRKLLLKCSRKTLKSTLISNMIALNLVRYPHYHMMYVAPNEQATKRFSHDYLSQRLASPSFQRIISKVAPNDVYVKGVEDSGSNIILTYASDDANRTRGPATDQNIFDEVQGMVKDILPIINETMAISKTKVGDPYGSEIYAGTPLTTDNTINQLWMTANQMEWMTKCEGCNHWNSLTEGNEPMKMIRPIGLCCSKCGKKLDTSKGLWADMNPGDHAIQGFHLAQPILPLYNSTEKSWGEVYKKCYGETAGSVLQIYNEVFGLPYDVGAKPITEGELKACCLLGPVKTVYDRFRHRWNSVFMAVDWGVNPESSRTVCSAAGMRDDGIIEVFFIKVFKNTDYESQIREIAAWAQKFQPMLFCDSGPDPLRGKMLGNMYDSTRTQLIRYTESPIAQYFDCPPQALDWSQMRWCLNRSDSMGFTMNQLKHKKILFPQWEDCSEFMQDILAIFTEVEEHDLKAKVFYRHKNPDDGFHVLNYITCAAHTRAGNSFFMASNGNV